MKTNPEPEKTHILKTMHFQIYDNPETHAAPLAAANKTDPRKADADGKPTG